MTAMMTNAPSGTNRFKLATALFALAAGQLAIPAIAVGSTEAVSLSTQAPDTDNAGEALAGKIWAEVGNLPKTASTEDVEASIIFVLSQENATAMAVNDALARLEADPNAQPTMKQAVANIRLALLKKKKPIVGTGALPGGGSGGRISGFSTPLVVIGGGSANYSS